MSHEAEHEYTQVTLKSAPWIALKGFCMGVAEIIPGVSGGTVALVLGVYSRFIDGIRSYAPKSVLRLLKGLGNNDRGPALRALHVDFLIPLFTGMGIAIVSLSGVMKHLLERYPAHMNALFFGMILASTYVPPTRMTTRGPLHLVLAVAGFGLAFTVVGMPFVETPKSLWMLFVFGAVAICAMVLPGVSGSYLLKVMGQYERVIGAIHDRDLVTVAVFAAGCFVGITSFVRVLGLLLRRFPSGTMAVLTGMMLGSLRSVWPFDETHSFASHGAPLVGLIFAGFFVVVGLIIVDKKFGGSA